MNLDRWDAIGATGLVLLTVGLWLIAAWLALTVAGSVLLLVALAGSFDQLYAEARHARDEARSRRAAEGS